MQPNKQKQVLLLSILIIALLAINYPFIDNALKDFLTDYNVVHVERVIDGDTIVANESIRLLGINSPERGELYYNEAKEYLEELILNKTIKLEFGKERKDKYNRILAYVYYNNKNINLELVQNGYANYYFYGGKDKYSNDLESAWEECINNNINLCEASIHQCSECISLTHNSIINSCNFSCDVSGWEIKAQGRDKIVFSEILRNGEELGFELELMETGDTLFLRDVEGGLILWGSY